MRHITFAGKGISSNMAPEVAVGKIEHLLISWTEKRCQDHRSLVAAYKSFDKYLTKSNINRPVVLSSDDYTLRFDYVVLQFVCIHEIRSFLSPPVTIDMIFSTCIVSSKYDNNINYPLNLISLPIIIFLKFSYGVL